MEEEEKELFDAEYFYNELGFSGLNKVRGFRVSFYRDHPIGAIKINVLVFLSIILNNIALGRRVKALGYLTLQIRILRKTRYIRFSM